MEANHVQGGKKIRLCTATADDGTGRDILLKKHMQEILSVYLIRVYSQSVILYVHLTRSLQFEGIPTFAPEHFARVRQIDTMKRKQFIKGISQIAQEGAIQIFQEYQYWNGRDYCRRCRCTSV